MTDEQLEKLAKWYRSEFERRTKAINEGASFNSSTTCNERTHMTDITNTHLEAAIIDQKVAGEFQGKVYAFVAIVEKDGWKLGVAVANEQGYNPIAGKTFAHKAEAKNWADGLNKHIGLSDIEVLDIISSTMRGPRVVVRYQESVMAAKRKKKKPGNRKFKAALDKLGLTVASQRTAQALGVGVRHCQRIAAGEQAVPRPVEIILELYHKNPKLVPPADDR